MGDGVFEPEDAARATARVTTTTMAPPETASAPEPDDLEIDLVHNEVHAGDLTVGFADDLEPAPAPHPHARRYLVFAAAALIIVFAATAAVLAGRARTKSPDRIATQPSVTAPVVSTVVTTTAVPTTVAPAPEPVAETPATTAPTVTARPRPVTTVGPADVPADLPPVIIDPPPGGPPDRVER